MENLSEQTGLVETRWELSGSLLDFAAEGDFALVRAVVDVFLADTEVKIESLLKAAGTQDIAGARQIAHSLKGAARQVGTLRLAADAERLEQCAAGIDESTFSLLVLAIAAGWREDRRSVIRGLERMGAAV